MLTLSRISPRNIHLNLFIGAHFHWRSLKACNIAKRTCMNYVWTAIIPWSYCSLKLQILRFRYCDVELEVLKLWSVDSHWNARRSHRRCSIRKRVLRNCAKFTGKHLYQSLFFKKETLARVFSCEFREISKNSFSTEYPPANASYAYVTW